MTEKTVHSAFFRVAQPIKQRTNLFYHFKTFDGISTYETPIYRLGINKYATVATLQRRSVTSTPWKVWKCDSKQKHISTNIGRVRKGEGDGATLQAGWNLRFQGGYYCKTLLCDHWSLIAHKGEQQVFCNSTTKVLHCQVSGFSFGHVLVGSDDLDLTVLRTMMQQELGEQPFVAINLKPMTER